MYYSYMDELKYTIEKAITEYGITHFISGMALGVDLDFAEIVLNLKYAKYPHITLECAFPCRNQTFRWKFKDKMRYWAIRKRADIVTYVSNYYTPDCMLKRNRYMVDKSDLVIAAFNGVKKGGTWHTINYAKKKNKAIEMIDLCKIKK